MLRRLPEEVVLTLCFILDVFSLLHNFNDALLSFLEVIVNFLNIKECLSHVNRTI